jgi:hypothetical protein
LWTYEAERRVERAARLSHHASRITHQRGVAVTVTV